MSAAVPLMRSPALSALPAMQELAQAGEFAGHGAAAAAVRGAPICARAALAHCALLITDSDVATRHAPRATRPGAVARTIRSRERLLFGCRNRAPAPGAVGS